MAYVENIPFTIAIKKREHIGYLGTNDTNDPPKHFFVFIDNYIIGNLLYTGNWKFQQVGSRLPRMTQGECNVLAQNFGELVVQWYE